MSHEALLRIQGLEVAYDSSRALRNVSLHVSAGSAVALLGANGAGKTTTIRAITGLLKLHGGRVSGGSATFDGRDLVGARSDRIVSWGIAQVPEGRKVFKHLTVEENLRIGAIGGGRRGRSTLDRIYDLFPVLGERRKSKVGWMSGGEQQMVAVGRALVAEPRLLLVDELSLGLAPLVIASIMRQLAVVREQTGTAVLMVEQNARLALEFCDYAYVLESGVMTLHGPAAKLTEDEEVRRAYLGIGDDPVSGAAEFGGRTARASVLGRSR